MAKRGVKKKDHEKLDDSNVARVIQLLEGENPITKKSACEYLNISYNTARLGNIIEEYKSKKEWKIKRREALKGVPFSDIELKELIVEYLSGTSVSKISDSLFRSIHIVKGMIKKLNLPARDKDASYFNPSLIDEEISSNDFDLGEFVWSARYNSVAEIMKYLYTDGNDNKVYSIWVFGKYNEFATQPSYELGKLEVLKNLSLRSDEFVKTEKSNFEYRIE